MTPQTDISVVIVAQNEERTIAEVLIAAKQLAAEIIFVDSGSTDRTVEIAKSFGVKYYHQDWLGYSAQKNYAIGLASCAWILSLDADEILTPALIAEIKAVLTNAMKAASSFRIPRLLYIGNRAIKHGGFYPDAQLRLFRRGAGKFNQRLVHEAIVVNSKVSTLKHPMLHRAYVDLEDFVCALEKYACLSAQEKSRQKLNYLQLSILNLWLHPVWTFILRYCLRAGFLDGIMGLKLSLIYSNYVRKKIAYLRAASI